MDTWQNLVAEYSLSGAVTARSECFTVKNCNFTALFYIILLHVGNTVQMLHYRNKRQKLQARFKIT